MRFACQTGCTKCCRLRGWVYLTEADLQRAADYLGLTPAEFEAQHAIRYRHVFRLRKLPRGQDQCRFLTAEGCSIHPANPRSAARIRSGRAWSRAGSDGA